MDNVTANSTISDNCSFDDEYIYERDDTEDRLAGGIIAAVSIIAFLWYCFVLFNIFRLSKKLSVFVVFFSQGIGDIGFLLNNLWLAADIIVGPPSLLKDTKIYSIAMNIFARPVLFHFLFIATISFVSVRYRSMFKKYFTIKMLISVCCLIWIGVWVEIGVMQIIWPSNAFVNHNIFLYGFYSKDICYYLASRYVIYLNAVNIIIGVLSLTCYLGSLSELRKSSLRKSREGKLLIYCFIDFLVVFFLYALKAALFSQIRHGTKLVLLFVQIVYTCTFAMSAILLPVFSADLWQTMFPGKPLILHNINPQSVTAAKLIKVKSSATPVRRFSTIDCPVVTVQQY